MQHITLNSPLPAVFAGSENEQPILSSQIWMRHITFDKGKYYLVEAESGTGKSSLCSFIYGARRDYTGQILFDDADIRNFSIGHWCDIRRRNIAYLPQEMMLFRELTVIENIQIKNKLTDSLSHAEILRMLDFLEISHKADSPAGLLSVGQQQRVAIVRALCQPFDFLLLDEPVSHLDNRNNIKVSTLVNSVAELNSAAVISTSVGNPLLLRHVTDRQVLSVNL